ncbi:phage tail assembly chaperone [Asticcacaulis sp. AND118]|uniref:phage tail assembly chaperone n=1 Tax=Asticcacaulis sp. AND118 TaxID=2840468 RepID=UPI001CFF6241|nr:phage tail assembly chaperone [Asticcacaulis sp. AND118]UDF03227.1 phage tail assembly chaperone [Asticcacaulis sp. AND118]
MTDWGAMMRVAVRDLHLSPADFWRLSWREWVWLTASPSARVLPRDDFEALKRAFPDD